MSLRKKKLDLYFHSRHIRLVAATLDLDLEDETGRKKRQIANRQKFIVRTHSR